MISKFQLREEGHALVALSEVWVIWLYMCKVLELLSQIALVCRLLDHQNRDRGSSSCHVDTV